MLWLSLYKWEESVYFWCWSGVGYGFRVFSHFPRHSRMWNFGRFINISYTFIQSLAALHETRRNEWCRQGNESTTLWERSAGCPDPYPNQSDPDSNRRSGLVEASKDQAVSCTWRWWRYKLPECYPSIDIVYYVVGDAMQSMLFMCLPAPSDSCF